MLFNSNIALPSTYPGFIGLCEVNSSQSVVKS